MQIQKIYIGGWFQRTTLHMSEVWDFLKYGKSQLDFPPEELAGAREVLVVSEVVRENGPLEYLAVKTNLGINFRIYEDGLIVLEKDFVSLKSDFKEIREYYESKLSKSLSLIFSKGAPVPKELANIKTILPYILNVADAERGCRAVIQRFFRRYLFGSFHAKCGSVSGGRHYFDQQLAR